MIDGLIAGKVYNQLQSRNDAKGKTFRTLLWRCGTLPGQLLGLATRIPESCPEGLSWRLLSGRNNLLLAIHAVEVAAKLQLVEPAELRDVVGHGFAA